MHIDRRALAGGAAALGAGAGIGADAMESEAFDEGVAVQRIYDAEGKLVAVEASSGPGRAWVALLQRN
jgi:hypothetical protein